MKYKIICHRGINRIKENTFESITEVINLQNNMINFVVEFDFQITKDNQIVYYFDENIIKELLCLKKNINININIGLLIHQNLDKEKILLIEYFKTLGMNYFIFNKDIFFNISENFNNLFTDFSIYVYTFFN